MSIPPSIDIALDDTILEYWRRRIAQHPHDSYAGVPIWKWPEDLRVYEHLLWESRANVVIELGVLHGGSALWFRDRLATNAAYGQADGTLQVIGVDVDLSSAREHLDRLDRAARAGIHLIEADVRDPDLPRQVQALLEPGARPLVVEDSAHTLETTKAALDGFAPFVAPGSFLVVEDTGMDVEDLRIDPSWPRGVLTALDDWLASDAAAGFVVRHDLELYGVTCHPGGFLQRS